MTRRVRMLQTTNGAPDPGTHTYTYHEGEVYDVTERLADVFVQWGFAEDASKDKTPPATPEGVEVPETEDERRVREAKANGGIQAPASLDHLDPAHHPNQAAAIEQAKSEAADAAQGADAPTVDKPLSKMNRDELNAAAAAIGIDAENMSNKDAVRAAIAEAQGQ